MPDQSTCYYEMTDVPVVMTVEEMGNLLRVGRNTAYSYVRNGIIPSIRCGKQIRVYKGDVFALRGRPPFTPSEQYIEQFFEKHLKKYLEQHIEQYIEQHIEQYMTPNNKHNNEQNIKRNFPYAIRISDSNNETLYYGILNAEQSQIPDP